MPIDDGKLEALLIELWQRHLPALRERLDILDRTSAEASSGSLSEKTRLEAYSIAHKLAGNLGMFGHSQSSEIASQLEQILKAPTSDTLTQLLPLTNSLRESLASSL